MAARMEMMATMQTISRRVKPASPRSESSRPADDIGARSGSTFLAIRSVGHDVVSPVLPRRTIEVGVAPRIVGNDRALQVGSVPRHRTAGALYQGYETFR